jgi:membrane fusion protein, multidrug efflux system
MRFTPPNPSEAQANPDSGLSLQLLYEEQRRLRREVEDLRKAQEEKNKPKKGESGVKKTDDSVRDQNGEDAEEKGEDQGKEKNGGEKEKGAEERKPPLRMRLKAWREEHPKGTILVILGTLIVVLAMIFIGRYIQSYEDTDDAFVDGHTDPVSPRISGFVSAVYVENTYRVKKGQLLVQLDPRDNQIAKQQAGANLAQAQAGVRAQTPNVPITATSQSTAVINAELAVSSSVANLAAAREKYQSALADLRQAQANATNAKDEAERYRLLVVKDEVSRELYDQRTTDQHAEEALVNSREESSRAAEKGVNQAEASLDQARQQLNEVRRNQMPQVAVQRETLSMRKAQLLAAQSQADQAELNLEYTRIYAPEDGIIGDKQVQVGSQVASGQELFALTEINDIWVTANFKETQVRNMRAGESVTIQVDALGTKFDGYVEALPGASGAVYSLLPPENATGNYVKVVQRLPVRIRFKPHQLGLDRLAPGMSVEPKVWVK